MGSSSKPAAGVRHSPDAGGQVNEDISTQVNQKLPGKTMVWVFMGVCVALVFIIGFGIGFGSAGGAGDLRQGAENCQEGGIPVYYFLANNSESCPELSGERLLTTVAEGESFEGLSVHLQCRGSYSPFPMAVRCERQGRTGGLQWSALPVCYPSLLVTPQHWSRVPHARSVSCSGTSDLTKCKLHCIQDYVAVEDKQYKCDMLPCRAWTPDSKKCYLCNSHCDKFAELNEPRASDLLQTLTCDPDCEKIVITSSGLAAVWQNNTKLYIDSSEPVPGGGGMWKNDTSIKFECYKKEMTPVQDCTCTKYKVYHTVYQNGTVPKAVDYLSGTFVKVEDKKDTFACW